MHSPEIAQLVLDDASVMLIVQTCLIERLTTRTHYEDYDTKRKHVYRLRLVREMV